MFKSIRSRLTLSFAGIALFAAVALGAVLLATLQSYYLNQEIAYLRGNAQSIGKVLTGMMTGSISHDEMQSQIENLAFLSQTRVQLYDPQGQLLYDSGSPQNVDVNFGVVKPVLVPPEAGQSTNEMVFISVGSMGPGSTRVRITAPAGAAGATPPVLPPLPESKGVVIYRSVQVNGSPYGFVLSGGESQVGRSNVRITELLNDPQSNHVLGSVTLSEGPAYGSAILASVARGWAFASAIAVLLAALVGWFVSRRISAPVLALTAVTTRMSQGDLSGRAEVKNQDELGRLARAFNEMADQVEGTVTTLRRFVSDAAHELRTPLTALRTNLDLAFQEKDPDQRQVFVERTQAMVKRLDELNTNLLDLSRLEANGQSAVETVMDLSSVLKERLELYASQAEQAGLGFESELPAEPVYLRGDAGRITRAMDNLVDNACKFTPQGGSMRVLLSRQADQAVFSVVDSGIGIPAEDLPQLFQRFHRGRNTTIYPGSGLGLAIVKAIVNVHHGQVAVQSAGEGQGSRFSISLPVIPPPVE